MNRLKLRALRQIRSILAFGFSLCLCCPVLAPAAAAKTESTQKLIKRLNDKNEFVRASAAEMLGKSNDPGAVDPLIAALQDPNPNVRMQAAVALGTIKDARAVGPMIARLKDMDARVRISAADALRNLKDPHSTEALIAEFKDTDSKVRDHAGQALIVLGTSAVDPLVAALKDPDANVRTYAAWTLGQIKDPAAVEPLIAASKDADANVRMNAAVALGVIKLPSAIEPLIELLKDTNIEVVRRAAGSLINIGPPAVEPLVAALNHANASVKSYAADTLSMMKDPRAVEPMVALIKDSDANVRAHAALALGGIDDSRTIDPLKAALMDTNPTVRVTAAGSLGKKGIVAERERDGRFIAYNNGTVLDTKTNLMWAAKDNGGEIDWDHAGAFCEHFRAGGYTDWRMPYQDELAGLYDAGKARKAPGDHSGGQSDIHVATELIQLTKSSILASVRPQPGLIGVIGIPVFLFQTGEATSAMMCGSSCGRVLPVRSADPANKKDASPNQPIVFDHF
jgi:HEAT repeat protein